MAEHLGNLGWIRFATLNAQAQGRRAELDARQVADELSLSETEAASLLREAKSLAAPKTAASISAVESRYSSDESKKWQLTRRFLLGSSTFVAGALFEQIAVPSIAKLTTDRETGLNWLDRLVGYDLPSDFVNWLYEHRVERKLPSQFSETPWHDEKPARLVVDIVNNFDTGKPLEQDELNQLDHLRSMSTAPRGRALLIDLLTAYQVRLGLGPDALGLLSELNSLAPGDDPLWQRQKIAFAERWANAHYITLKPEDYLNVRVWEFEPVLALLNQTAGGLLRMNVQQQGDGLYVLKTPPVLTDVAVTTVVDVFGVPGFYLITLGLLYLVASSSPQQRRELMDIQYRIHHAFRHRLERAVWNSSYEACIQLHRLGEQRARDKLLTACVGSEVFWGRSLLSTIQKRIEGLEEMPCCFALFLAGTPGLNAWHRALSYPLLKLAADWPRKAQRLRMAADHVRKARGEEVDTRRAYDRWGASTNALGVYLPPFSDLMRELMQ